MSSKIGPTSQRRPLAWQAAGRPTTTIATEIVRLPVSPWPARSSICDLNATNEVQLKSQTQSNDSTVAGRHRVSAALFEFATTIRAHGDAVGAVIRDYADDAIGPLFGLPKRPACANAAVGLSTWNSTTRPVDYATSQGSGPGPTSSSGPVAGAMARADEMPPNSGGRSGGGVPTDDDLADSLAAQREAAASTVVTGEADQTGYPVPRGASRRAVALAALAALSILIGLVIGVTILVAASVLLGDLFGS